MQVKIDGDDDDDDVEMKPRGRIETLRITALLN